MTKKIALITALWMVSLFTHSSALAQSLYVGENPENLKTEPAISSLEQLQNLNRRLIRMVPKIQAATVCIIPKGSSSEGSGVIIRKEGLILTAAHVIDQSVKGVYIVFTDGTIRTGTVLGADYDRDAAMVQINEPGSYPFVEMGDSSSVRQNQWVIAIGNSQGFKRNRSAPVRFGRIFLKDSFVATDAVVVGGDSGGPLFDTDGKVIGIHSHIGISLGENHHVPIEVFYSQWDALKNGKNWGKYFKDLTLSQPSIGLKFAESKNGAKLLEVVPDSPTDRAGLKKNDLIIGANGKKIYSPKQFMNVLRVASDGSTIRIWYQRNGEKSACRLQLLKNIKPNLERPTEIDKAKPIDSDQNKQILTESADQLLRIAAQRHGYIKMTPELYKHFGGVDQIRDYLSKKRAKNFQKFKLFSDSYIRLLQPLADNYIDNIGSVRVNAKPVAMGTVISKQGLVLTTHIKYNNKPITVILKKKVHQASILKHFPAYNLTLLKIDQQKIPPIHFQISDISLGSLVHAVKSDGNPTGIGIVSVSPRPVIENMPLGITLEDHKNGASISKLTEESPAQKAGLKLNDVITQFAGETITSSLQLRFLIDSLEANKIFEVVFLRANKKKKIKLQLERLKTINNRPQKLTAGKLSSKTSGFAEVIQHDISIPPELCGGPLIDIEGRCIGVNVSRAGRTKTYAVTAKKILSLIKEYDVTQK